MKKIIYILILFHSLMVFGQDRIVRSNGEIVKCKIISIDSSIIRFTIKRKGESISTSLPRSRINNYSGKSQKRMNKLITMDPLWDYKSDTINVDKSYRKQAVERTTVISGQIGYSAEKFLDDNSTRSAELILQPQIGFDFGDRSEIGFNLTFIRTVAENVDLDLPDQEDFNISLGLIVGPYTRVYYLSNKFKIYNEFNPNIGIFSFKDETGNDYDDVKLIWLKLNTGFTYRFHDLMALDLKIGVLEFIRNFNDDSDGFDNIAIGLSTNFNSAQLGLRWYF